MADENWYRNEVWNDEIEKCSLKGASLKGARFTEMGNKMDWISKLFDVYKLPFKIIAWVAFVSGILLFSPDSFLNLLKLDGLLEKNGSVIGIVFVASTGLVVVNIFAWLFSLVKSKRHVSQLKKNMEQALLRLDHSEKAVLREFYIRGKYNIDLPIDDPTVVGLMNKGIIYRSGNYGQHTLEGILLPCAINDNARDFITLDLIEMPATSNPSKQEIERIRNTRPQFAKDIARREALFKL